MQALGLLADMVARGGIAVETGPDARPRVAVVLLPDGVTILRYGCAPEASAVGIATALLDGIAARLAAAAATMAGLRMLIDLLVASLGLALALAAILSADAARDQAVRVAIVGVGWTAIVHLRAPVLRWIVRRFVRRAHA